LPTKHGKKSNADASDGRWPRRFGLALTAVTFPLIWVGGLVTTYDAGMAVPDWPGTYGYNLFAYPWSTWFFGPWDLFIEHGHRLLGSLAGLLTIGFLVSVFWQDERGWLKLAGVLALVLVIAQGVLGGVRVLAADQQIAKIHGCVGPAFFAFAVALTVFTSRFWRQAAERSPRLSQNQLLLIRAVTIGTLSFAYLQLVIGAHLRHLDVSAGPGQFTTLVYLHLFTAGILLLNIFLAALLMQTGPYGDLGGRRVSWGLCLLVIVQIGLGCATYVVQYGWPSGLNDATQTAGFTILSKGMLQANITTAHVAIGSLILAAATYVAVKTLRATRFSKVASAAAVGLEKVASV
jgi:cytochrome c oxidase assembly protein subunit 15